MSNQPQTTMRELCEKAEPGTFTVQSHNDAQDAKKEIAARLSPDVVMALVEALETTQAVKHCMMFEQIHDVISRQEVLSKFAVTNVQMLARLATERAEDALSLLNGQTEGRG